jgi:hypothetical protein
VRWGHGDHNRSEASSTRSSSTAPTSTLRLAGGIRQIVSVHPMGNDGLLDPLGLQGRRVHHQRRGRQPSLHLPAGGVQVPGLLGVVLRDRHHLDESHPARGRFVEERRREGPLSTALRTVIYVVVGLLAVSFVVFLFATCGGEPTPGVS